MEGQGAEIFPIPTLPRRFLPPPHQPPPGPASHTGNERLAGSEQGWQQRRVLLNHLPHVLELGLIPQEFQGVLSCWQEERVRSDTTLASLKYGGVGMSQVP